MLALEWLGDEEPRAVGDPKHVETSFARNLGGLIRVRLGRPDLASRTSAHGHANGAPLSSGARRSRNGWCDSSR
jgi:hypothetical protein